MKTPTLIRERSGSNLGRHTGNSRWRFSVFSSVSQANARHILSHPLQNVRATSIYLHGEGSFWRSWQSLSQSRNSHHFMEPVVFTALANTPLPVPVHSLKNLNHTLLSNFFNPLKPELNPTCYLLALLAHHFLHVSRIRVKSLTLRLLSYIYIYIYIYIWSTYS